MIGIGLFIIVFGYAIVYWGVEAIQGHSQDSFVDYIFPFTKNNQLGLNPPFGGHTVGREPAPPGARGPVGKPSKKPVVKPPTGAKGPVG